MTFADKNTALYNSRIIDTYIKLIRSRYSYVNLSQLLTYAGMESYEIADQGHWFTQEQVDLFFEKLVQVTGNSDIAREAGRYAASPESLGAMRQYALGLIGPANAFRLVKKISQSFTRSSTYVSHMLSSTKMEITVSPNEGVQEKPFQCENRIGFFEAFVMMFKDRVPHIEHTECMFKGGSCCRYIVSWESSWSEKLKITRKIAVFLTLLFSVAALFYPVSNMELVIYILSISVFILFLSLLSVSVENKELLSHIDSVRSTSENLIDQININYNNALLANEFGQTLNKQTNVGSILSNSIQILQKHLDYDRGVVLLADAGKTELSFQTGFGYSEEQIALLKKTGFSLTKPESKGAFVVCFREQRPLLVNDVNEMRDTLSLKSQSLAIKLGTKSFICCPIVYENESLGILAVENCESRRPLVQRDMSLLMGIAPVIGISIRNATLIEGKQKQFTSLLKVLAASIDARDSLTAGHSEKVTEYAVGICHELGLPEDYTEAIRVAALLHDYGKIGVPDSILKKEGKLTEEEYQMVKMHSVKTKELLEQINFEGMLSQVPEIAGCHHEKIDGSGYPRGLTGKDIPLGAKIIAVADFFEAITSKRHYRDPMPLAVALELLEKESGTHFERKIVRAFTTYYERCQRSEDLKMFV